jgi:hypothetical protein
MILATDGFPSYVNKELSVFILFAILFLLFSPADLCCHAPVSLRTQTAGVFLSECAAAKRAAQNYRCTDVSY